MIWYDLFATFSYDVCLWYCVGPVYSAFHCGCLVLCTLFLFYHIVPYRTVLHHIVLVDSSVLRITLVHGNHDFISSLASPMDGLNGLLNNPNAFLFMCL